AGEAHAAVEAGVARVDLEQRPVVRHQQVALHDRQVAGHRMPEDVDLMAPGARLGNRLDGDVVVAEELDLDAGKHLAERRRDPVDLAPMRAPDDDLAFAPGGLVERAHLRRVVPARRRSVRGEPDGEQRRACDDLQQVPAHGAHALKTSTTLRSVLSIRKLPASNTTGGACGSKLTPAGSRPAAIASTWRCSSRRAMATPES